MQKSVAFYSEGVKLAGDLFLPAGIEVLVLSSSYAPGREAHLYERLNYFPTARWLSFFPPDACKTTYMHIGPVITNLIIYGGVQSSAVRAADTDVHSKRSSRLDTRVERV